MDFWLGKFATWSKTLHQNLPGIPLGQLSNPLPLDPATAWEFLGDAAYLPSPSMEREAAQCLATGITSSESTPKFDSALDSVSQTQEGRLSYYLDQSRERILDSYRYLLSDRVQELFPVEVWATHFQDQRLLRQDSHGGYSWRSPVSQKGKEKLAVLLLESLEKRLNDVSQDCLSALKTRSSRLRTEFLAERGLEEDKNLKDLFRFFERGLALGYRDLLLSVLVPLRWTMMKILDELPQRFESLEDLYSHLKTLFGVAQFPMAEVEFLERGWKLQAVLYGTVIHLGLLTDMEMRLSLLWKNKIPKSDPQPRTMKEALA